MKVTFTPGPGDVQTWEFNPDDVMQSQAELVEKRYGKDWDSFVSDVRTGSAKARRVLLWHLLSLTHHTLRIEDTPAFRMGDLKVTHSLAELYDLRSRVEKAGLPEDEKATIVAALDNDIADLEGDAPDPTPDDGEGKASEPVG